DLGWTGQFGMVLTLYTEVFDRFDYSSSAYMIYFGPGYVTLQRVQAGAGTINLGQGQIPGMQQKNSVHIEVSTQKEDASFTFLVDGVAVQRWKDNGGFVAKGSGAAFFSQLEGATVKLSNMKVSEWEGRYELIPTNSVPAKEDIIYLVNRDRVTGTIDGI